MTQPSTNPLVKQLQNISGDESLGTTKHQKAGSLAHDNSRVKERAVENAEPQITYEMLRSQKEQILPEILNPDPNYRYKWFAMDQNGQSNYYYSISKLGYSPVKVTDMPEMAGFVYSKTIDPSIAKDNIVVKEMILCKIHIDNWTKIMTYNHHIAPSELESDVFSRFENNVKAHRGSGFIGMNKAQSPYEEEKDEDSLSVPLSLQTGLNGELMRHKPSFQ